MQALVFDRPNNQSKNIFTVKSFNRVDSPTIHRLESLGIHIGSLGQVVRRYPFNGPIIMQIEQQQIAVRAVVFQQLTED